jgi:hypothetical protein
MPNNNLSVESGETVLLSPDSARFKDAYKQLFPRTIEEVRNAIGLSEDVAKALQVRSVSSLTLRRASSLTATTIRAEDILSDDRDARFRARALTFEAARQFVVSPDTSHLTQLVPAINQFLVATKAILNIANLLDINVANGATLTISANTHALNANKVTIHGTGRILCQGRLTFKIQSLQGITLFIPIPINIGPNL